MESLLHFLTRTSVSLVFFYGLYFMLLRNDSNLRLKRFSLLSGMLVSMLMPWISIPVSPSIGPPVEAFQLSEVGISNPVSGNHPIISVFFYLYLIVAGLLLLRFIWRMYQILMLIVVNPRQKFGKNTLVFIGRQDISPFSFFKFIFLPSGFGELPVPDELLCHEKVHSRQLHSADMVFADLYTVVFWFHPVAWLYYRSLRATHEYLADRQVLDSGVPKKSYQQLLVSHALGIPHQGPVSGFKQSLIKRRILMMNKPKKQWPAFVKFFSMLPISAAFIFAMGLNAGEIGTALASAADIPVFRSLSLPGGLLGLPEDHVPSAVNNQIPDGKDTSKPFRVVEKMPEFPGGQSALTDFIVSHVKYPKNSMEKNVQGVVYVSFTITEKGKVIDISVLRGVNNELDAEAMRVVGLMPDWNPGTEKGKPVAVAFTLPVRFALK